MKRLEIHTEYARIGIRTHNAKMTIKNNIRRFTAEHKLPEPILDDPKASAYESKQSPPVQILPAGDVVEISRQFRGAPQEGTVMQYAAQGEEDQSAKQAAIRVTRQAPKEPPKEPVKQSEPSIEWDVGYTKINWAPYELQINWDEDYMPDFNVEPHSVEIFLENKPSITISVVEDGLMITHGRRVDQKV